MTRYWILVASIAGVFLMLFLGTVAMGWTLENPTPLLQAGGVIAAVVSIGLLVIDVLAPVPASLVMLANGALFGAVLGSLLSSIGGMLAFAAAFALGRANAPVVGRIVGVDERQRADAMLEHHGALAVAVSRPIPIVSETTALMAGASSLSWVRATGAAFVGVLPQAIAYAVVGGAVASFSPGAIAFVVIVGLAVTLWMVLPRFAQ